MQQEETAVLDSPFAKAQRGVLRDQVAEAIRCAIATGRLRQGDRVNESEIAARMGVSKAPVREALRLLESEGLVTTVPLKGSVVTTVSADDVLEIFGVRSALERLAVGLVVERPNTSLLRELRAAVDAMRLYAQQVDYPRTSEADTHFHELIVSHSGNGRVARFWADMNGQIHMLVHVNIRMRASEAHIGRDWLMNLPDRHEVILSAIERGDRVGAQELLESHVLAAGRRLAALLTSKAPQESS